MNAKNKIEGFIDTANELIAAGATISAPEFRAWKTDVLSFLEAQCGKDSNRYIECKKRMCDMPGAAGLYGKNVILREEIETTIIELQEYMAEIEDVAERPANELEGQVTDKKKMFIGSSTNGLTRAKALKRLIETKSDGKVECTIWNEKRLFKLSYATIDSLIEIADNLKSGKGFAVLVFTPDDEVTINKGRASKESRQMAPRDNVVFEMGLFMGRLGRDRVICVRPEDKGLRLLSDWEGMTDVLYRYQKTHIEKSMEHPAQVIVEAVVGG